MLNELSMLPSMPINYVLTLRSDRSAASATCTYRALVANCCHHRLFESSAAKHVATLEHLSWRGWVSACGLWNGSCANTVRESPLLHKKHRRDDVECAHVPTNMWMRLRCSIKFRFSPRVASFPLACIDVHASFRVLPRLSPDVPTFMRPWQGSSSRRCDWHTHKVGAFAWVMPSGSRTRTIQNCAKRARRRKKSCERKGGKKNRKKRSGEYGSEAKQRNQSIRSRMRMMKMKSIGSKEERRRRKSEGEKRSRRRKRRSSSDALVPYSRSKQS